MSIATKTGDGGETALMYGRRVPKTHPRVNAYGAVDELNAALGMARAFAADPRLSEQLLAAQKELVGLMGELAVDDADRDRYRNDGYAAATPEMVARVTAAIDQIEKHERVSMKGWATPGATPAAAGLDLARTVCRRAEREIVRLGETGAFVNPDAIRYLNRLSDLCWLLARREETRHNAPPAPDGG